MNPIVEASGLKKKYGHFTAVDGTSFSIQPGECFGFLGPNGAGKTTTVRMIHCSSLPTEGSLRIFGMDVSTQSREIKAKIGVCHQEDSLDPDFSVFRNLQIWARYYEIPPAEAKKRATDLLHFFGIWEKRDEGIRELSGGMKRRLMIARALVNQPDFLVLDEPTTGLDPQSRHQVWDRIRELRKQGKTILLTTHYMDEAQALCDRLVIMDHGKILIDGVPQTLVRTGVGKQIVEVWETPPEVIQLAKDRGWKFETHTDRMFIYADEGEPIYHELSTKFALERCAIRTAGLEDLFLKLTGRDLRE